MTGPELTGIEEAAAGWIVRRDAAALAPEESAQFEAWLIADARHREAYLRLLRAWRLGDQLGVAHRARSAAQRIPARHTACARTRRWGAMAACLLGLIVALGAFHWLSPSPGGWVRYETEIGGFHRFTLADGSIVELNTDSALRVRLSPTHRELLLERGEAAFKVAHDSARPFDVSAGESIVRAVGTAFTVRLREAGAIELTVVEGRVLLANREALDEIAVDVGNMPLIEAGQISTASREGVVVRPAPPSDLDRRLAWQDGQLVFDGEPLADAVAEFNRYNTRQLRIVDPAVAALRVGGRFRVSDPDAFIGALSRSFGVEAAPAPGGDEILLSSR